MTQYVGRILREHPGKLGVDVHDYADTKIPMLARMHGKRLTTYRRLGFAAASATAPPGSLHSRLCVSSRFSTTSVRWPSLAWCLCG
jgi:hypothetical protein